MLNSTVDLVAEICRDPDPADQVPSCVADSATTAIRFSRPLSGDSGTLVLRIGAWTVRPQRDASPDSMPVFGTQEECTLRHEAGIWRVLSCRNTMIT